MSKKVRIRLTSGDQDGLKALIANRDTPRKRVRWAWIVPHAGNGAGTGEIQRGQDVS